MSLSICACNLASSAWAAAISFCTCWRFLLRKATLLSQEVFMPSSDFFLSSTCMRLLATRVLASSRSFFSACTCWCRSRIMSPCAFWNAEYSRTYLIRRYICVRFCAEKMNISLSCTLWFLCMAVTALAYFTLRSSKSLVRRFNCV